MMRWFSHNLGLKLVSLFLAFGLWSYAVGEEGIEVTRNIPLEIQVKNPQVNILTASVDYVQVTFLASRAVLSELASEDLRAVHEIGEDVQAAGEYSFRLEPSEIQMATRQVRIAKVEPEIIQVTLDEVIVQKLKIEPNFAGEPAFGYKVEDEEIQVNPNAIMIEGAKGQLEKLDTVKTERIDLVGRIRSFRRMVTLQLPPNVKTLSEDAIDVYIPIREELGEKLLEAVPVKVLRSPQENGSISVNPSEISFALKGSIAQLERLLPENVLAYVDLSTLESGEHEVPVKIFLPEGVNLKDEAPVVLISMTAKE